MARFLPEYKEIDTRPPWEKTAMMISIFFVLLLVPTTVLGYYSESSLPGQPLYPFKRGIESMVLVVESFTPYKKSLYYQTLATRRVNETATIVAQAEANGNFSSADVSASDTTLTDVVTTVQQAAKTTQTISDPVQKQLAQQQLASSIKNYQTQLTQMHYTIEQRLITPTPTPMSTETVSNQQIQATDTPTPTQTQTASSSNIQNQITQTQNDLQNVTDILNTTPSPTPPVTPTSIPTKIPTPSSTPTPTHKGNHGNFNFFHFQQN